MPWHGCPPAPARPTTGDGSPTNSLTIPVTGHSQSPRLSAELSRPRHARAPGAELSRPSCTRAPGAELKLSLDLDLTATPEEERSWNGGTRSSISAASTT